MNPLYILYAILVFGLLIFIHELGHFIVARLCGVKVLEFAIGMGPKLFSWKGKKTGTVYALRLLPIGGFVNMLGENGMEAVQGENGMEAVQVENGTTLEDEKTPEQESAKLSPEVAKQAYCNQSVWKRILISIAGPAMNIYIAYAIACGNISLLLPSRRIKGSKKISPPVIIISPLAVDSRRLDVVYLPALASSFAPSRRLT